MVSYRDCAAMAAFLLGLNEVEDALKLGGDIADENIKTEAERLLECVNLAVDIVTDECIPLVKNECITASGGRILYADFEKLPAMILSLKSEGVSAVFRRRHDCLEVDNDKEYEVIYSYKPVKGGFDSSLPWDSASVGERIVAYGAACEYALLNERHEEAAVFDRRFKDALESVASPRAEVKVKRRRWL